MTTLSNLYAEKVFAEHPISLWTLDESVDYVSMISEEDRDISLWNFSDDPSVESYANESEILNTIPSLGFPSIIFPNSYTNKVTLFDAEDGETLEATLESTKLFTPADFDPTIKNFSIGTYVYPFARAIDFKVGFYYNDSNGQLHSESKTFHIGDVEKWAYVSEMFTVPEDFQNLIVQFSVPYTGPTDNYYFLINGISIGQLSEQFNVESLGVEPVDVNTLEEQQIFNQPVFGVPAYSYGLQSISGYYLANNWRMCAVNAGMPLVYGAGSSTQITPNVSGLPSLIVPGLGFMNESGVNNDLTLEMWLRIQSKTTESLRIVGPIASSDGLYVEDSFITLKVGAKSGAYYINEWTRPMLVSIRYSKNTASLSINGEQVITLDMSGQQTSFPEKYVVVDTDTYNQDWIGFYSYEDVPLIEIDCVGIYPYIVPAIMEKRRLVYGQGVGDIPGVTSSELSAIVSADYTVANYAKNYSYPDIGRWQQGVNENLLIDNQTIGLPQYGLPSIVFNNRSITEWYEDVSKVDSLYGTAMSLKPITETASYDWSQNEGYILFDTLNLLNQDTKAIYGLFESDPTNEQKQTLIKIENYLTNDSLTISLTGSTVAYEISYVNVDGTTTTETIYSESEHVPGNFLFVGLDIEKFVLSFGGRVPSIFGSKKSLKVTFAGSKNFTNTFSGKIYRIGFCTARNLQKIAVAFSSQGIAVGYNALEALPEFLSDASDQNFTNNNQYIAESGDLLWENILDGGDSYFGNLSTSFEQVIDGGSVYTILVDKILSHIASYTLVPKVMFGKFSLDVAVNGYWQDYLPLSYFGKYVNDGSNNQYYDVDFIQYNVSYPAISKFVNYKYDTSNSVVRTYISFDYLKNSPTIEPGYFSSIVGASKDNTIEPGDDWYKKLYEITDNTVIYLPSNIDINSIALVLHIEILSKGIIQNPVKIQSLQLSSRALNAFTPNPIGTKYGSDVFPYRKAGGYFDYKGRNPMTISKSSVPYLYLTKNSGFRLHQSSTLNIERGISVPINKTSSQFYKLAGIQFNAMFTGELFPNKVVEIMQMQSNNDYIKIYMVPDSLYAQRARLYVIDANTGLPKDGVMFYINGRKVSTPIININSWHMIGLVFNSPVDFSNNIGAIRMTGPLTWNNLVQYQSTLADEESRTVYRSWSSVKTVDSELQDWQYWKDLVTADGQPFAWRDVLFISTSDAALISGTEIYQKYTGTNRIIIDTDNTFRLKNYEYSVYNDLVWNTSTVSPV